MADPIKTLAVRISADAAEFQKALQVTSAQMAGLQKVAKASAAGASVAFAGLTAALVLATRESSEALTAERSLAAAFRATGQALDLEHYKAFASAMQNVTTYGDDAIVSMGALLGTFGVSQRALEELTPTILNVATTYGKTLPDAAEFFGKALSGNTTALRKMGVVLSEQQVKIFEVGTEAQRTAELVKIFGERTGDSARIAANTASGAFSQLRNALGDFAEKAGKAVDAPLAATFRGVTAAVNAMPDAMGAVVGVLGTLGLGFTGLLAKYAVVIAYGPKIVASFQLVATFMKTTMLPVIAAVAVAMGALAAGFALGVAGYTAINRMQGGGDQSVSLGDEVKANLSGVMDMLRKDLSSFASGLGDAEVATDAATQATGEFSKKIIRSADAIEKAERERAADEKAVADMIGKNWAKMEEDARFATIDLSNSLDEAADAAKKFADETSDRGRGGRITPGGGYMPNAGMTVPGTPPPDTGREITWRDRSGRENLINASKAFSDSIIGSLGEAGSVIQNGIQGFAQGGPFGAIAAVASDLISRSAAFKESSADLQQALGELVEAFEPLAEAMQPMTAVTNEFLRIFAQILKPVFEFIGPVFMWLAEVLRKVGLAVLYIVKGLGSIWNGIVGAVSSLLRKLADISVFGSHPFRALDGWADTVDRAKISMGDLNNTIDNLQHAGELQKEEIHRDKDETKNLGDAMATAADAAKTTASVLNSPQGYKVELARFNASVRDPRLGTTASAAAPGGAAPIATGPVVNVETVQVVANDPAALARALQDIDRYASFRMSGRIAPAAPSPVTARAR